MSIVFVDTSYYIALVNSRDEFAQSAYRFSASYEGTFLTTAWVITELANFLAKSANRRLFLDLLAELERDHLVEIVPSTPELYERGLRLYRKRPDKDWSLTDCISFETMREQSVADALTSDHHFEQAGFNVLLK